MNKIKKVVLREDYLSICDNANEAIVLAQLLYWAERVKDADKLIKEENLHLVKEDINEREMFYGWIYKSAIQLEEELMGFISRRTITNILNSLVEKGYIHKRRNPKLKWDRTYQYRVDLITIAIKLKENGYNLEGYSLNDISNAMENNTTPLAKIANGKENNSNRKEPDAKQYQRLLTEITPDIIYKNLSEDFVEREDFNKLDFLKFIFNESYKYIYTTDYNFTKKEEKLLNDFIKEKYAFEKCIKVFLTLPYYYFNKFEGSNDIIQYHFTPNFLLSTFRFNEVLVHLVNDDLTKIKLIEKNLSDEFNEFSKTYENFTYDKLNNIDLILEGFKEFLIKRGELK